MSLTLVGGCFGFNGPLRQYFNPHRDVSQREGERKKKDKRDENLPNHPYARSKDSKPLPFRPRTFRPKQAKNPGTILPITFVPLLFCKKCEESLP